jgi:lipopolysaccharide transport system permease protein
LDNLTNESKRENALAAFQALSPEELKQLADQSTWRFDTATIAWQAQEWRAPEFYHHAMTLVGAGTTAERERAVVLFTTFLSQVPVFAEGHFQLARLYFQQGLLAASLQFARNAAVMAPQIFAYQILLVAMLTVSGRTAEADAQARLCQSLFPGKISGAGDGETDRGVLLGEHLNAVLPNYIFANGTIQPTEAYLAQVLVDFSSADPVRVRAAVSNLRHFIRANPTWAAARFLLAEYERRQGNIAAALNLCGETPRQTLDWPLLIETGVLQWASDRRNAALASFEEAALICHDLPIFSPQHIDAESAERLVQWYRSILDGVSIEAGSYGARWNIGEPPPIRSVVPQNNRPWGALARDAWQDLTQALERAPAWWLLARNDLAARYRRTALGPWWLVLSSAIALVGMALVWSLIFNMEMKDFFPYLSAGYATWLLLNSVIVEGCGVFTDGQAAMVQKNLNLPRLLHVFRLVTRNFLLFAHTIAIFVGGAVYYGIAVTSNTVLVIPGLLLLYLNALWLVMFLGLIGARFRDFAPAVGAFMTVVFFVTPVLWRADMLRERAHIADLNPFTHLIAIVREPLLGASASHLSWSVAILLCIAGWTVTFVVFSWLRQRIVFWL